MSRHKASWSLKRWMSKFRSSLMSKYLLIILAALLFIPFIFPLTSGVYVLVEQLVYKNNKEELKYGNYNEVKNRWHEEAARLSGSTRELIAARLHELSREYPEASMFWVDADGYTQLSLMEHEHDPPPDYWPHAQIIHFMKNNVNSDPFTVVAFVEPHQEKEGFMVFQIERSLLEREYLVNLVSPFYMVFVVLLFGVFMLLSLLFFRQIRKRLLRLQAAMVNQDLNGLPLPIEPSRQDEIGQLEAAFNQMVDKLQVSRQKGLEEEQLRKKLISNLSHDLRTPMTVMNSHIYKLGKEVGLSNEARGSLKQLELKMDGLSSLIENLLSYNLMTSGRYTLKLEETDIPRLVKESAAAWYPLWEREEIEAEVELSGSSMLWTVDRQAFRRVLDNLFQNIVRHASDGHYIGIKQGKWRLDEAIIIEDRGSGIHHESGSKGAGLGLAIVDYLIREMGLAWEMTSSAEGTIVYLYRVG